MTDVAVVREAGTAPVERSAGRAEPGPTRDYSPALDAPTGPRRQRVVEFPGDMPSRMAWHPDNAGQRDGGEPGDGAESADSLVTVVVDRLDLPVQLPGEEPFVWGRLEEANGERTPLFDGKPSREQAAQDDFSDCGYFSTFRGVAGHLPDAITAAAQEVGERGYRVLLHEARFTGRNRVEPTGRQLEILMTDEMPQDSDNLHKGTAWAAVLEKGFAAVDRTWDEGRRAGATAEGYARIDEGTDAWARAEILTMLTGKPAVVSPLDKTAGREAEVEAELSKQLADGKPIIIGVPEPPRGDKLPFGLIGAHAYEVVEVSNGMVRMENPWNMDHPEPMSIRDFLDNVRDVYTTLE